MGSLGLAISEAVEESASEPGVCYTLGSVLNHVALHQTVIGLEAKKQFDKIGLYPDMVFGHLRRRIKLRRHRVSLKHLPKVGKRGCIGCIGCIGGRWRRSVVLKGSISRPPHRPLPASRRGPC